MKILITNDDGIYAQGIHDLAVAILKGGHQIAVVAPDRERSASGHAITIIDPLRAKRVNLDNINTSECFKVSGTPADCVKLGIEKLISFEPDLIISGINDGPNLGYDVLYSGTVSAAIEGWMMGYTSIAVSLATQELSNFKGAAYYINKLINNVQDLARKENMLLNVNIPDLTEEEYQGQAITVLGKSLYEDHFEERVDPMGNKYYWLAGESISEAEQATDIWTVNNNIISITPLKLDLNHQQHRGLLKKFCK